MSVPTCMRGVGVDDVEVRLRRAEIGKLSCLVLNMRMSTAAHPHRTDTSNASASANQHQVNLPFVEQNIG
eukprot:2408536-Pyramimonas_sp.AAC.1